ncbi:MAG TPA: NosD domain-containing protein [Gemmatimonadales bacterium]|nr:NosD domain-containing protein [Gemmatimonadales bacterium]
MAPRSVGTTLCAGLLAALLVPGASVAAQRSTPPPTVELRAGLVISHSVRVVAKTYRLAAPPSLDSAVITVRGDDVTVDFRGATLQGLDAEADPDGAAGVAIRVDGGRNVTILRARVRGYRVGLLARDTRGLALVDNDVSYTWKPRLFSLVEHESLVDWLSFHRNEHDEWLRYGAAIYLAGVSGGEIHGTRAEQGMNGLMLVRADHLRIWDNDFSFNSGAGIALYRATDNLILGNRIDYDVRGYSHRFYRRGQDSAGLLVYEQSARNVVAYNSITHGGDGVFLWAGQSTMDSGTGGANDNVFYDNDCSFAPANGIEATFSRNTFVANRAVGNEYGMWGGYSFGSRVVGNDLSGNRVGIAIEHGQENVIARNRFADDSTAISLWADSIAPSDWGYPKHRDTRSRDYRVEENVFVRDRVALRARYTTDVVMARNRWMAVDSLAALRDTARVQLLANVASAGDAGGDSLGLPSVPAEYGLLAPAPPPSGVALPTSALARRARSAIVVDEWGPYDWRSPLLWPVDSTRAIPLGLAVLGPAGQWRLVARRGVRTVSRTSGRIGDTVLVTPAPTSAGDWDVTLEYRGGETVSPRGVRHAAGQPYRFWFARFEPPVDWTVRFFAWSDSTDPRTRAEAFAALLGSTPLLTRRAPRLDYEWYRPSIPGLPPERFALEATGSVTLAPMAHGAYTLRTISDDAVRVWVDGALVIDRWTPHESTVDHAALAPGRHALRVQYYQVDGWTELRLEFVRGTERSTGSPGPH